MSAELIETGASIREKPHVSAPDLDEKIPAEVQPLLDSENLSHAIFVASDQFSVASSQKRIQEFEACIDSDKMHLDFYSRRFPDACTDPSHLRLLEAMSETDY